MAERFHRHTMPLYWAAMEGVAQRGVRTGYSSREWSKQGSTGPGFGATPMPYLFDETVVVRFSDGRNPGFIEGVVGSELELAA